MMIVSAKRSRISLLALGVLVAAVAMMGLSLESAAAAAKPKLVIDKKSKSVVQNGQQIVFTITVKNEGGAVSKNTKITDLVPAGLEVSSADSPCTVSGQLVSCVVGNLAPGQEASYKIYATALLPDFDAANDQLTVSKVEEQVSMPAGSTSSGMITCSDGIMSDGSFRVDSVDQGTGNLQSVDVIRLESVNSSSYRYVLKNNATGQAQAKIFGVCLPKKTTEGNPLLVGGKLTEVKTVNRGVRTLDINPGCPDDTTPISPGYIASSAVTLIRSEPNSSNGRKFTFRVYDNNVKITASIRCLSNTTGGVKTNLQFTSVKRSVQVAPRSIVTERVSCPVGYKGIVAGWRFNSRLAPLGNDPQPISRDFKISNPTDQTRSATLHLLCIRIRTWDAPAPVVIINTAFASSTNAQDPMAVLSASKTVTVTP